MIARNPLLFRITIFFSMSLFVAACFLPATEVWESSLAGGPERYRTKYGSTCLLIGWFGLLAHKVAWLANPLALIGAVLLIKRQHTGAAAFSTASAFIAMLYVLVPVGVSDHPDVPRMGAWLWMGSFLALTLAVLIRQVASRDTALKAQ